MAISTKQWLVLGRKMAPKLQFCLVVCSKCIRRVHTCTLGKTKSGWLIERASQVWIIIFLHDEATPQEIWCIFSKLSVKMFLFTADPQLYRQWMISEPPILFFKLSLYGLDPRSFHTFIILAHKSLFQVFFPVICNLAFWSLLLLRGLYLQQQTGLMCSAQCTTGFFLSHVCATTFCFASLSPDVNFFSAQ